MKLQQFDKLAKDIDAQIQYYEGQNKKVLGLILCDSNINNTVMTLHKQLKENFNDILNKQEHGNFYIDMYNHDYVISKLYGFEIHKLKEYFAQTRDFINIELFCLALMKLLKSPIEESPYVFNGIRELYEIIFLKKKDLANTIKFKSKLEQEVFKNINMIRFEDFVENYMSIQKSEDLYINDKEIIVHQDMYSLVDAKLQDKYLHKHEIKKVVYATSINVVAMSEDQLQEILLYDKHMNHFSSLKFSKELHNAQTFIILDFDYSESKHEFAISLQDNTVSFFRYSEKFKKENIIHSIKLHLKIKYLEVIQKWISVNTSNQLIIWDTEQQNEKEAQISLGGGKIQHIFEIAIKKFICFVTDQRKIYVYNQYLTERMIVIKENSIYHQVSFNILTQSFYTTSFNHQIQKWQLEETGTDYTKDIKFQVCKQEQMILSFAFIMNDTVLITLDSTCTIHAYDTITFQLIAQSKKQLKKTTNMKIIQLWKQHFGILGQRLYVFYLVKKNEIRQDSDGFLHLDTMISPLLDQSFSSEQTDINESQRSEAMMSSFQILDGIVKQIKLRSQQKTKSSKDIIQENQQPTLKVIHKQQFSMVQFVDVQSQLQQLEHNKLVRYLNGQPLQQEEPKEIQEIKDYICGDPNQRLKRFHQEESLKKMALSLYKIDGAIDQVEQLQTTQNKIHKTINVSKIQKNKDQFLTTMKLTKQSQSTKKQQKKKKYYLFSSEDYLKYFNYDPFEAQQTTLQSTHQDINLVRQTFQRTRETEKLKTLKKIQLSNKLHYFDENKRKIFTEVLQLNKTNTNKDESYIGKTWFKNKKNLVEKHLKDFQELLPPLTINSLHQSNQNLVSNQNESSISKQLQSLTPYERIDNYLYKIRNNQNTPINFTREEAQTLKKTKQYLEKAKQCLDFIELQDKIIGSNL